PDPQIRDKHPLPKPSALEGPLDGRRVRAFVIDALEQAAQAAQETVTDLRFGLAEGEVR
ncbi:MAG: hypothetical protein H0X45_08965, partial [Planctomycetes bacterium]|nr:hypothetical protein [Planctomycetota bacterium]